MDSRVLIGIGVVLLLFSVSLFFQSYSIYYARGESMKPTFSECMIVLANKMVNPNTLQTGDIVVVDINGLNTQYTEFVHRIVENNVLAQQFSTRGDNVALYDFPTSIDGYFSYDKFLGKVIWYINCLGGE